MRPPSMSVTAWMVACALVGAGLGTYALNSTPWTARALQAAPPARSASAVNVMTAEHVTAPRADEHPYLCRGYEKFDVANPPAQVMQDRVTIQGYPAATVGDGRGSISWFHNPVRQPVWSMWLHSQRWLGALIQQSRTSPAYRERVAAVMQNWIAANPYPWNGTPAAAESTMHRLNVMSCFRETLTPGRAPLPASYAWLDRSIQAHLKSLATRWTGSNHATDQSIAMLGVACNLRLPDYISLASTRLRSGLAAAIDDEGATSEQSTGYANMNYFLWYRAASTLKRCGVEPQLVADIERRRARMLDFLAHAHTPLGTMVQIGDTDGHPYAPIKGTTQEYTATRGESGLPPQERIKIYQAGYVFGRSGWGSNREEYTQQSMYALRFGPPTAWHGHHDHTALTWFTQGRPILIDPGYGSSPNDSLRPYLTSAAAHNQLTVPGMGGSAPHTTLVDYHYHEDEETYVLTDAPAPGVTRTRHVVIHHQPDVVVISDVATADRTTTFTQNWHHPIGSSAMKGSDGTITTGPDGARTWVRVLQSNAPTTIATSTAPAWQDHFRQESHAVSTVSVKGTSARIVTVISPTELGIDSRPDGDRTAYRLSSGDRSFTVHVSRDGALVH